MKITSPSFAHTATATRGGAVTPGVAPSSSRHHRSARRHRLVPTALALACGVVSLAAAAAPPAAAWRKIEVRDARVAARLEAEGARLVQGYDGCQLLLAEPALADRYAGEPGVIQRHEYDRLFLPGGVIDSSEGSASPAPPAAAGPALRLVQFSAPITPVWRDALLQTGVRLIASVPANALLVMGDPPSLGRVDALAGAGIPVQWTGAYPAELKIGPGLLDGKSQEKQAAPVPVRVRLAVDAKTNPATLALLGAPDTRQPAGRDLLDLVLTLPPARLPAIAARPDVVSLTAANEPAAAVLLKGEKSDGMKAADAIGDRLATLGVSPSPLLAAAVSHTLSMPDSEKTETPEGSAERAIRVLDQDLLAALDGNHAVLRDQLAEDVLTGSGQLRTFTGRVLDPGQPFRVTLAWTDSVAGLSPASNGSDLDLEVTVGGKTYRGTVSGDNPPEGVASTDGRMESVFVPAGVTGPWVVTVRAGGLVSLDGSEPVQGFVLVATNAAPTPEAATIVADSSSLLSENCSPGNAVIDVGETVTVSLSLRNTGTTDTANLVGTLRSTGGVLFPSAPQSYGVVVAGGAAVARNFTFVASNQLTCGATLTATLDLQDGATNLGTATFNFVLGQAISGPFSFANPASIGWAAGVTTGAAALYPSTIAVSGLTGTVSRVTVTLNNFSHTFPSDVDVLLVSPTGQKFILMSDTGSSTDAVNVTYTLDDAAATVMNTTLNGTGTWRPTNYTTGDTWAAPAPAAPYLTPATAGTATLASAFNGSDPNGTWSLYVTDDASGDTGSIAGGWAINVTTQSPVCCTQPVVINPAGSAVTGENCTPANGVIDPAETVTVSLTLTNTGSAPTSNLVATLEATGGVLLPSGPQSYGAIPPGGSAARSFSFRADPNLACGGGITATLDLADGATQLGIATFAFVTGTGGTTPFSNPASINWGAATTGPAALYPSNIAVSGLTGTITRVTVTLNNFSHTFPSDVDVLLVSPTGQKFILMSDTGSSTDAVNVTYTLDDAAATVMNTTLNGTGAWRPTNYTTGDTWAAPAPAAPYLTPATAGTATLASAFNGSDPNGTWSLYVTDDASGDTGSIAGGWSLNITTATCCGGPPVIQAVPPASLTAENCGTGNGAADPAETVTLSFPLQNVGVSDTSNLVATLRPTGGVTLPSGPQSYGALIAGGASVSRSFSFKVDSNLNCGGSVTATFDLQDGLLNLGSVSFPIVLGPPAGAPATFNNPAALTIPSGAPTTTSGPAAPYPSTINVVGLTGTVASVKVSIFGLSHTFPSDLDLLLVGPTGESLIFMSDAGGSNDLVGVDLSFDDAAASLLPTTLIAAGTYRPTNYTTGDTFAAPAPAGPYGNAATAGSATFSSVFGGTLPNGAWSLYLVDDIGGDHGTLAGGWSITLTTSDCCIICEAPGTLTMDPPSSGSGNASCAASHTFNTSLSAGNGTMSYDCAIASPPGGSASPATFSIQRNRINPASFTSTMTGTGLYTATCTATNACGQSNQASATFTVLDTTAPALTCQAIETPCGPLRATEPVESLRPADPPEAALLRERARSFLKRTGVAPEALDELLDRVAEAAREGSIAEDLVAALSEAPAGRQGMAVGDEFADKAAWLVRGYAASFLGEAGARALDERLGREQKAAGGRASAAPTPEVAPIEDVCVGAQSIPGAGPFPYLSGVVDLTDATSGGDPTPSCPASSSRGVWFSFTPAASGGYTFSTCVAGTTRTDTVLAVFSSPAFCSGPFTEIGCDDDSCVSPALQSIISGVNLNAGTTYYILAYSYGTTAPGAGLGNVQLEVSQSPITNCSTCAAPLATLPPPTPSCQFAPGQTTTSCASQFYQVALQAGVPYVFTTCSSVCTGASGGYDTRIRIYPVTCGTALVNNDDASPTCTAGATPPFTANGLLSAAYYTPAASGNYVVEVTGFTTTSVGPYVLGYKRVLGPNDVAVCPDGCASLSATGTDNCSTPTVVLQSSSPGAPVCAGNPCQAQFPAAGDYAYTWLATDGAGLNRNCTSTVVVRDACDSVCNFNPLADAGGPLTGNCRQVTVNAATASDANGEALSYVWTSANPAVTLSPASGTIPAGSGVRPVPPVVATLDPSVAPCGVSADLTLTVTDGCGLTAIGLVTVTFDDRDAPTLVVPADQTVSCEAVPPATGGASASDGCDPAPVVTYLGETRTDGSCADNYTLLRRWEARDHCGNLASGSQTITVRDLTPPTPAAVMQPTAPLPPQGPHSVCAPPTVRQFQVQCSATDNCDPSPQVQAVMVATNHGVVGRPGTCSPVVERIPVLCGETIELRMLAAPCPARGPRSPHPALAVNSGLKVISAEEAILEVTVTDRCGNSALTTYDPTQAPSPLCDDVLVDGTCCPAIAKPMPVRCSVPVCSGPQLRLPRGAGAVTAGGGAARRR